MILIFTNSILILLIFVEATDPDFGRKCEAGETGKPGIRYFADRERNVAYPFGYLGCGGNEENRFDDISSAHMRLIPDMPNCPGWTKSGGDCYEGLPSGSGMSFEGAHSGDPIPIKKCKEGYSCMNAGPSLGGICCDKKAIELSLENRKAKCPDGMKAVTVDYFGGFEQPLFGRTCSHNFCPSDAKCIEGDFEAYCCKKQ